MKGPAMALHSPGSLNAASGGMAYSADPEEERGEDEMNISEWKSKPRRTDRMAATARWTTQLNIRIIQPNYSQRAASRCDVSITETHPKTKIPPKGELNAYTHQINHKNGTAAGTARTRNTTNGRGTCNSTDGTRFTSKPDSRTVKLEYTTSHQSKTRPISTIRRSLD